MAEDVVVYHKNCKDGFGAAYACWKYFGNGAKYMTAQYGSKPLRITNSNVYLVDFSYTRKDLLELEKNNKKVLVLDHHATAEKELAGLGFCRFDLQKSGAVMAWEHFHPDTVVPQLILHIQDRDLWNWELDFSKEINLALDSYPMDFEVWDKLMDPDNLIDLIDEGSAISRFMDIQVSKGARSAKLKHFYGHDVPVANCAVFISEIGNQLALNSPFAATFFINSKGQTVFSLRSSKDNPLAVDVGAFADSLVKKGLAISGGGHKHAGGCVLVNERDVLDADVEE